MKTKKAQKGKNKDMDSATDPQRKNILMIMVDEFRFPIDKDAGGMIADLKNIFGFQNIDEGADASISIKAKALFPGFMRLRKNAVALKNHTVATSACVPSRAALFTGQYGTVQGVTQTDGVFKSGNDINWLKERGVPTIGDWFRANNYSTHYFGKCHFAHPKVPDLNGWGFDNWETSFPEPHGTMKNNLGMYRDTGFTDLVTTFIRRKAMALDYDQEVGKIEMDESIPEDQKPGKIAEIEMKPWFAVVSFTNPHDITTWPVLPAKAVGVPVDDEPLYKFLKPLGIPAKGTISTPPDMGTWTFDMNPGGIDESYASLPTTWNETLQDKPDCQFDYSIKLGIALAAKTGSPDMAENCAQLTGLPLTLALKPGVWSEAYIQYYTYLHHLLDQQINRVMKTLEDSGLREDTIVLFVPDHGEYGASHGMMMQKWHTAYQEAIHVPVVVSLPDGYPGTVEGDTPRQIEELTSHIDLAPTLLGLAGVTEEDLQDLSGQLKGRVLPFVGQDLSGLIRGETSTVEDQFDANGNPREAILFTTSDMITEPCDLNEDNKDYEIFKKAVGVYKFDKGALPLLPAQKTKTERLALGPVMQPAEVHCVRQKNADGDWKLVRYRDYHDPTNEDKYQWEMYNLDNDAMESINLLKYDETFAANQAAVDAGTMTAGEIVDQANLLKTKLDKLIDNML